MVALSPEERGMTASAVGDGVWWESKGVLDGECVDGQKKNGG